MQDPSSKINELTIQVDKCTPDIIFVTETWLTVNIPHEAIPVPDFNLFRNDRPSGRGGGVSINVNNEFPINIRNDICNQSFECLWLTLRPKWLPRSVPRRAVACVYLPPSIAPDTLGNLYDYFQSCYDILTIENSDTTVIVAGDFNPTGNGFNPKILTKHCDLKQIIKKPTRNANILDFVKILKIFPGFLQFL